MKKLPAFILGNIIGIVVFTGIVQASTIESTVLSVRDENNEEEVQEIPTSTPIPTDTPTPSPTNTPTPSPTSTPIPTNTPMPTNTPAPSLTPTPTTAPTSTPSEEVLSLSENTVAAPANLDNLFTQYANHYGVEKQVLVQIASCESGFNPGATNGPYAGLYQFTENLWIRTREEMGHDPNPALRMDANESIKTASYLISQGKLFFWPNCI